jgi:hypothetical protein
MQPESSAKLVARSPRFAEPEYVADLGGCWFYHSMDLPGIGEVQGHWDLRPTVDAYLGRIDFAGKRVLDVGTASGYLSFAMEEPGRRSFPSTSTAAIEDTWCPMQRHARMDCRHSRRRSLWARS